jgi:hypothetical protein
MAGADVLTGRYFEQGSVVDDAEGLQDFRRRQEGHLIIADNRPLLVMAFGTKFKGKNENKYKIEGKHDIPVGYKVIIKWVEDEIVFMTRKGHFGPEFQIVYLPKSAVQEDFTIFEWNSNIAEIWNQFLTVVEGKDDKDDRDMSLFNQGPWRTFGVTRDEVQIALKQGVDETTNIEGILYCADGQIPSLEEHLRYLGFDPTTDEHFIWIFQAFKDEPKPSYMYQYVKDCMVYWVDGRDQIATWKHPWYEKYKRMLHTARVKKVLPHWKEIMAFRIEFLLTQLFTEENENPHVETVENVIEMSRIFGVDIKNEPYLVHVLRRALRHYGDAVREQRKVKDVEDFRNLMQRYRDLVEQFERANDEERKRVAEQKVCVECDTKDAVMFCDQCRDFFCEGCFNRLHSKGRRQNHLRTWVEMGTCAECTESIALFHCVQCADLYCRDCYQEWHVRGGRRNHIPIVLRSFNSQTDKLAVAKPLLGTGCARILSQARSPWFSFSDENNVKLYYDIIEGQSRRDMPLAIINEPIEESTGGGIAGSWAGTWGGNMFKDQRGAGQRALADSTI